ncbi:hypothetical protein BJV74DRAFT_800323, partial [Russula compacta]
GGDGGGSGGRWCQWRLQRARFSFPGNDKCPWPCADDEPSIEDLLAAESASPAPKDGSWGARAWEELDVGVTVRRIETHDTVAPRRDPARQQRQCR